MFDPKGFLEELEMFKTDNISTENIKISDRAHVIFPYHKELDALSEEARGDLKIGTTKKVLDLVIWIKQRDLVLEYVT